MCCEKSLEATGASSCVPREFKQTRVRPEPWPERALREEPARTARPQRDISAMTLNEGSNGTADDALIPCPLSTFYHVSRDSRRQAGTGSSERDPVLDLRVWNRFLLLIR